MLVRVSNTLQMRVIPQNSNSYLEVLILSDSLEHYSAFLKEIIMSFFFFNQLLHVTVDFDFRRPTLEIRFFVEYKPKVNVEQTAILFQH